MTEFIYCSRCGVHLEQTGEAPHCPQCGTAYYHNAKPTASILPIRDGKVLLARRGREPYKGAFDAIGGFLHEDELPEAGALREAKEETGLDMKIIGLLGFYIDQYGEDGDYTLNIHFIGEVTGGEMKPQDDVVALEWVPLDGPPITGGFKNTQEAFRELQKWATMNSTNHNT